MDFKNKILVLEDDTNLSYLIRDYLLALHYEVAICHTGSDAILMAKSASFDLFILDIMLPDISGFEVAKQIAKFKINKPFIFLTAIHNDADRYQGYELGAEDYITKPFTFKELEYKIKIILRRNITSIELDQYTHANLSINFSTRELLIDNIMCKLTKKETELMKIFIAHKNEYVERSTILEIIWERDDIYTARSMDVHMNRLRKKIGSSNAITIENIYGSGYRLLELNQ